MTAFGSALRAASSLIMRINAHRSLYRFHRLYSFFWGLGRILLARPFAVDEDDLAQHLPFIRSRPAMGASQVLVGILRHVECEGDLGPPLTC
jgi:hypothetical protein